MNIAELISWAKDKDGRRKVMWVIEKEKIRELTFQDLGLSILEDTELNFDKPQTGELDIF